MTFLAKETNDRWHRAAWWLCVVTLPWAIVANNVALIFLTLVWIAEGGFQKKWKQFKTAKWAWPFLLYYMLLMVGMAYTTEPSTGWASVERKIPFLILPIIAATARTIDERSFRFLKQSFIYSCLAVTLVCISVAAYHYLYGSTAENFDAYTLQNFDALHPGVPTAWMHFSYIQLAKWAGLHPGYLSMYLVFCLVILFTENHQSNTGKIVHAIIACFIVGFLALLAIRMAIIAFFCAAIYLIIIKKTLKNQLQSVASIAGASFILAFLLWLNPVARFRVIEEPLTTTYQADKSVIQWNSVSYRLLEWEGSWSVIKANWLVGVGTGGGEAAMNNFYNHFNGSTIGLGLNAHNQFLQTWMEYGLVGLVLFSLCLWAGLYPMRFEPAYACFILIFSLMCLTESVAERQKGIIFFMVFQSLFLSSTKKGK